MRHLGTLPFETQRLMLRPLTPDDAPAMFKNWASDPEVTRFLSWPAHKDELETFQLLAAWDCLYQNHDNYRWGICLKETGELIGSISLFECEQTPAAAVCEALQLDTTHGSWEAGYCIGRAFWGKGYITEALRAVRDFWFLQVGADWLCCCHAEENTASGRVMEKIGMRYQHNSVHKKQNGTSLPCRTYYLKNPNPGKGPEPFAT